MHNEKPFEQNATGSSLGFHSRRALAGLSPGSRLFQGTSPWCPTLCCDDTAAGPRSRQWWTRGPFFDWRSEYQSAKWANRCVLW